jgi:hypothetical protein
MYRRCGNHGGDVHFIDDRPRIYVYYVAPSIMAYLYVRVQHGKGIHIRVALAVVPWSRAQDIGGQTN